MDKYTKQATKTVEKFNAKYPIGTPVTYQGNETVTTNIAQVMCGSAVVWCEGISGCVDLEHITVNR